jgi:hypothetical protein
VQGCPLAGATVYAYRRLSEPLGPADFAGTPSGRDGAYVIDLVEGSYWLVARKRFSGSDAGPLVPGDLQSIHADNPATSPAGFTGRPGPGGDARPDVLARRPARPDGTGIRGRITDEAGAPVAWVFAMAYTGPDMRRVPDFTSAMTAEDGRYVIFLPAGGRYWVGARKHIREKPAEGEPFGLYDGAPDHAVEVATGSFVDGIDIVLRGFGETRDGR